MPPKVKKNQVDAGVVKKNQVDLEAAKPVKSQKSAPIQQVVVVSSAVAPEPALPNAPGCCCCRCCCTAKSGLKIGLYLTMIATLYNLVATIVNFVLQTGQTNLFYVAMVVGGCVVAFIVQVNLLFALRSNNARRLSFWTWTYTIFWTISFLVELAALAWITYIIHAALGAEQTPLAYANALYFSIFFGGTLSLVINIVVTLPLNIWMMNRLFAQKRFLKVIQHMK